MFAEIIVLPVFRLLPNLRGPKFYDDALFMVAARPSLNASLFMRYCEPLFFFFLSP